MNLSIAIITEDIVFPKYFESLLYRKFSNIEIVICKSLLEINEKLDTTSCKLVLLDGCISRMSSIEIIQHIRSIKRVASPIWFFPEIQTDEYIYKSFEMGVNRIIRKPFDPFIITDEIKYCVD